MSSSTSPSSVARAALGRMVGLLRGPWAVRRQQADVGPRGPSAAVAFRPWLLAGLGMLGIEVGYKAAAKPDRLERTNFLNHSFCQPEPVQRAMVYEKLRVQRFSDPDVLFVGDSSCNHGVIPHVAMAEIPGFKVVNLGVATNVGYGGHLALAEYMLRKSPGIRYVVLYNCMVGGQPRKMTVEGEKGHELMADDIHNEFVSRPRAVLQIPTLAARKDVFRYVAYRNGALQDRDAPLTSNVGYQMLTATNRDCHGWCRETDFPGDFPAGIFYKQSPEKWTASDVGAVETHFDWGSMRTRTYIETTYQQFADLARRYDAKLVVMNNPVPASLKTRFTDVFRLDEIVEEVRRFGTAHPEVHVPNELAYWPDDKFSTFSHVSTLYSHESARRAGLILKDVIAKDGATPRPRPADFVTREAPEKADVDFARPFCAFGWGPVENHGQRYVSAHDRAFLYAVVKPGREYTVRLHFNTTTVTALNRLKVRVNDAELAEVGRTWGGPHTIDYRLPADAASRHLGWFRMEVDIRPAAGDTADAGPAGRRLALGRVEVVPVETATPAGGQ
ncbi:MAG TPA: hypothetical protein VD866_17570 [Urbifossiella sp.]|nr:hypothetical protein [Urbifossiella sp.]